MRVLAASTVSESLLVIPHRSFLLRFCISSSHLSFSVLAISYNGLIGWLNQSTNTFIQINDNIGEKEDVIKQRTKNTETCEH
jgi:hypothetical protein